MAVPTFNWFEKDLVTYWLIHKGYDDLLVYADRS